MARWRVIRHNVRERSPHSAADGMGIPLSLADPDITPASAAQDVMAALRELLRPGG
jgi:hypothetical protein